MASKRELSRVVATAIAVIGLLASPTLYSFSAEMYIDPDPFAYALAADRTVHGAKLYSEAWENKPPLGIMMYALPGRVAPRSYSALCIFLGLILALQAAIWMFALRRDSEVASVAVICTVLLPFIKTNFLWLSTEHCSNLFLVMAFALCHGLLQRSDSSWRRCVAIGFFLGLSVLIRQTTGLYAIVPLLCILQLPQSFRRRLLLGFVLVCGLFGALILGVGFVLKFGDWSGFVFTMTEHARRFSEASDPLDAFRSLRWFFLETPLPLLLFLTLFLAPSRRTGILNTLFLLVAIAVSVAPLRLSAHYWANLFPVLTFALVQTLRELELRFPGMALRSTFVGIAFLIPVVAVRIDDMSSHREMLEYGEIATEVDRLASRSGGTVWAYGPMGVEAVQWFAQTPPVHTHAITFELRKPYVDTLPQSRQKLFDDYLQRPPTILVAPSSQYETAREVTTKPTIGLADFASQIFLALIQTQHYRMEKQLHGYVILVQEPLEIAPPPRLRSREDDGR